MNAPDRSIDLLVDGELDEESRRILLAQLDADPDGWRRCALAFLEAQAWQSAARSAAKPSSAPAFAVAKPPRNGRAGAWLARAACVLVAFAVGRASGRIRGDSPSVEAVQSTPAPPKRDTPAIAARSTDPQTPAPRSPGYLQAKLEREGYKIEQRTWIMPARTPSGRRVGVPVEQTKVRFVGNRAI